LARSTAVRRRKVAAPFPWRVLFVVAGVAGLAALGTAAMSSRRIREGYVMPMGKAALVPLAAAVAPQADRVWEETRPWRNQMARAFASINTSDVRDQVASQLSRWIDRLR
jgi:hypothetical protein